MRNSSIEWTHHTMNPICGCQGVSPGCAFCYAESFANRRHIQHGPRGERRVASERHWAEPLIWHRRAVRVGERHRVFCCSLADVFDNKWPDGVRPRLFRLIRDTPNLDWLLLTKRPGNIASMLPADWGPSGYANVWLGISAENQEWFDRRWPVLSSVPAVVRFVSYEPAIGPLALRAGLQPEWIICGGESGNRRGLRTMDIDWARSIRDQCARREIAFFFKQWGTYAANPMLANLGKEAARAIDAHGKGGGLLDGRLHRDFPEAIMEAA